MTNQAEVGNESNMTKVREMMKQETAESIGLGEKARNEVSIEYVSDMGKRYTGTIVFKRPSVMDYMKMGAAKSEILRNSGVRDLTLVDSGVKLMAQIIGTLKTVVVKSPEWLVRIDSVEDTDLLFHVYGEYQEWERSFRTSADDFPAEGASPASE